MNKPFILLLLLPACVPAQKSKTIHPAILGARFSLVDFHSQKPFGTIQNMAPGLGFGFVKGIGNHVDWTLSTEGHFPDSVTDTTLSDKKLLFQSEVGIRARMFTSERRFQSVGSIMDNIAEGFERSSRFEFINSLSISKGETGEFKSQLYRCLDNNYISPELFKELYNLADELTKMITSLIRYLNTSTTRGQKFKNRVINE